MKDDGSPPKKPVRHKTLEDSGDNPFGDDDHSRIGALDAAMRNKRSFDRAPQAARVPLVITPDGKAQETPAGGVVPTAGGTPAAGRDAAPGAASSSWLLIAIIVGAVGVLVAVWLLLARG